jgi:hypothetical protein
LSCVAELALPSSAASNIGGEVNALIDCTRETFKETPIASNYYPESRTALAGQRAFLG